MIFILIIFLFLLNLVSKCDLEAELKSSLCINDDRAYVTLSFFCSLEPNLLSRVHILYGVRDYSWRLNENEHPCSVRVCVYIGKLACGSKVSSLVL